MTNDVLFSFSRATPLAHRMPRNLSLVVRQNILHTPQIHLRVVGKIKGWCTRSEKFALCVSAFRNSFCCGQKNARRERRNILSTFGREFHHLGRCGTSYLRGSRQRTPLSKASLPTFHGRSIPRPRQEESEVEHLLRSSIHHIIETYGLRILVK